MLRKLVLRDPRNARWLVFEHPVAELSAYRSADVRDVLEELRRGVDRRGLFAAGFLGYEAAPAFDAALTVNPTHRLPVACFGLFTEPRAVEEPGPAPAGYRPAGNWSLQTGRAAYRDRIATIKREIALGNCYQVNYTIRQQAELSADPWNLFLAVAPDMPYAAYLDCDDHAIVSASPELFFSLSGTEVRCRPMKGTARRGMTSRDDREARRTLYTSAKDRAENVMIADMVRNDVGRIAAAGSVRADSLYDIEKYPTVWQMTSTVTARTEAPVPEIIAALFPCASVTGAPKAASMAIIADLEDSPREIYTGAIGYFAPTREAQFSVAIRTAWVDKRSGVATYGIGGGIVWDSDPDDEFDECAAKARILGTAAGERDFRLLETMRWTGEDGYFLLDRHLDRLLESAEYFDFRCDRGSVLRSLEELAARLDGGRYRVRLTVCRDGTVDVDHTALFGDGPGAPRRVRLAANPIDADDVFLYHKTTRRGFYERAVRAMPDCDDVLLYNVDGFVTETTIANILVELNGTWCTPPVSCGLLAGTYRQWLLETEAVEERRIHVEELGQSTGLLLVNSVRGKVSAILAR